MHPPPSRPLADAYADACADSRGALRIGDVAPGFSARSTKGPVSLLDYRGRSVLLFAHPADFTPVCTSEFVALARLQPAFEAIGVALLGLSVDSLYAHLAWVEAIERELGVAIPFPIVEDSGMVIARAYGMLAADHQSTATVRSCFFIDPDGLIEAALAYPAHVGRSAAELLRVATALVEARKSGLLAPEGWQPGMLMAAPPPEQADGLAPGWFATFRQSPGS
ncbi:redoxin domain-containing protein [Thermaurantiacus sp.]